MSASFSTGLIGGNFVIGDNRIISISPSSGTNTAGQNLTLQAGQGTGTGTGGSIIFQTAPGGSSGASNNALATKMSINTDSIQIVDTLSLTKSSGTGLSVTKDATIGGNLTVTGNLTVSGTSTTINTTTLDVEDINITLAKGNTTPANANGGGITLKAGSDKTIIYDQSQDRWTSNIDWNIASGKVFKINGSSVLSSTALGSTVVGSSLTSVGTIVTGVWNATAIADGKIASAATWNAKQSALTFGKNSGNTLKSEEALTTNDILLMGTNNVKGRTYSELKTDLSLNSVENTALSTWSGSANITTVGTITTGTWNATAIAVAKGGTGATSASAARTALGVDAAGTVNYTLPTASASALGGVRVGSGLSMSGETLSVTSSGKWSGSTDIYYNGGKVGIGETSPGAKLHIKNTDSNSLIRIEADRTSGSTNYEAGIEFWNNEGDTSTSTSTYPSSKIISGFDNANYHHCWIKFKTHHANANNLVDTMTIKGPNVGIGTTSPNAPLEIHGGAGSGDEVLILSNSKDSSYTNIHAIFLDGGAHYDVYNSSTIQDGKSTSNGEAFHMNRYSAGDIGMCFGGGNVGIGDSTPSYKLDVTGTGRFTDTLSLTKSSGTGLSVTKDATIGGNLIVTGNLTVSGTTTTVNSTTMTVDDPIITLGGDTAPGSDDNKDRGVEFRYYSGSAKVGFMGWDDSAGSFVVLKDATNSSEVFSGTAAELKVGSLTIGSDTVSNLSSLLTTSSALSSLSNVATTAPSNNQVLTWNGSAWAPANASGGGGSATVNGSSQTFAQLMTEQPNKFNQDGSTTVTSSNITIDWIYTDIIPTDTNLRKFAQGSTVKSRCLPYIKEIRIDIKGTVTGTHSSQNDTWINYTTLNISTSQDYNTTAALKTIQFTKTAPGNIDNSAILNILGKTDTFYVRIYGVNDSTNDYPNVSTRALVISTAFLAAAPPSQPLFQSDVSKYNTSNEHHLVSNFKVAYTENNVSGSTAVIDDYNTTFSEKAGTTTRSGYFSQSAHNGTYGTTLSNIQKNTNFSIKVGNKNLRAGTKYDYTITVTNNISSTNSAASVSQASPFTLLPSSNSIGTSLTLTEGTTETSVSTSSLDNSSVIYLITSSTEFTPTSVASQVIEITDPYSAGQEDTTQGYGKYVDDTDDLVIVGLKIGGSTVESIKFNGFKTTSPEAAGTITQSGTTYFNTATIADMYSDVNNKGFRLKGTVQLKNILASNIGSAQTAAYTLQYTYSRHAHVGSGGGNGDSYNIYIDNLTVDPTIGVTGTDSATVTSVKHCMGIPSVEKISISLARSYTNINTTNKFVVGNRQIAKITSIQNTSWASDIHTIAKADIVTTGVYTKTYAKIDQYYNTNVNGGTNNSNTSLTITESATSLKGKTDSTSNNLIVDHFYDHSSFTRSGSTLTPKLSLTDIYQITNTTELAKLNTNVGGIGTTQFSSHGTAAKAWTLLYINGNFKTNAAFTYPDTGDYVWNDVTITSYTSGTSAYSTTGVAANSNGYKWIVLKLTKTSTQEDSGNSFSAGYRFMGTNYDIYRNDDNINYLNLENVLGNSLFATTTITKLLNSTNTDAIGFCRATKINTTTKIMGSFKKAYGPTGESWVVNGTGSRSYAEITSGTDSAEHGSIVDDGSDGKGIYIDKTAIKDDLKLFIGFKNTVSL